MSWDMNKGHVTGVKSEDLARGSSTVIAFFLNPAYPGGGAAGGNPALGLVQNISIQQQKNIPEVWECGSIIRYLTPGVVVGRMQASRLIAKDGGTFLKKAYGAAVGASEFSFAITNAATYKPIGVLIAAYKPADTGPGGCIGGVFLESFYFESTAFQVTAQGDVIAETASGKFENLIDVDGLTADGLIAEQV